MTQYNGEAMAKIARDAANLIETKGLARGLMRDSGGCMCLQGAVLCSAGVGYLEDYYSYLRKNPNSQGTYVLEQVALRAGLEFDTLDDEKVTSLGWQVQMFSDQCSDADDIIDTLRQAADAFESNAFV